MHARVFAEWRVGLQTGNCSRFRIGSCALRQRFYPHSPEPPETTKSKHLLEVSESRLKDFILQQRIPASLAQLLNVRSTAPCALVRRKFRTSVFSSRCGNLVSLRWFATGVTATTRGVCRWQILPVPYMISARVSGTCAGIPVFAQIFAFSSGFSHSAFASCIK